MSTITTLTIEAPAAPANWSAPETAAGPSIAAFKPRTLLPIGPSFLAHARRTIHNRSFDDDFAEAEAERRRLEEERANDVGEDDLGVGDEEESPELLARDAKEWKGQDHYAVLGLSKFRYKATPDQIKIAHRKKVLKHHPDKKANSGDSNNDQFFKCVQKALEILSNPEKRRQFDSVDPYYGSLDDEYDPTDFAKRATKNPDSFFKLFGPVFEREARFSKKTPVPLLGSVDASKAEVEGFYDFWYNFDSWRSFEYLDKEVNEGSDSRDDKRYTEKKNKSERARRKKEDNTRLRSLVDTALSVDPRIKRIKQEEKEERDRKKNKGKPNPKEEEARLKKEAEEAAKAQAEKDAADKAAAKKAKAAAANAAKKARRAEREAAEAAGTA